MSESGLQFTKPQMLAGLMASSSMQQPQCGCRYHLRRSLVSSRMNEHDLRCLTSSWDIYSKDTKSSIVFSYFNGHLLSVCSFVLSFSGMFSQMATLYKRWLTSQMVHIRGTVFLFFVYALFLLSIYSSYIQTYGIWFLQKALIFMEPITITLHFYHQFTCNTV